MRYGKHATWGRKVVEQDMIANGAIRCTNEVFGDPATLNCDRGSQGDVYVANMSHSVSRARALEDMDSGLLPQKWMGQRILPVHQDFGCDLDASWQIAASVAWVCSNL